ncbi:hypothetical protein, partial [Microbulbifer sp. 2205BS26-8]|uniref:hypothetical protein n=1 Tax=Microbulbifer sp. 2205BS26-8 TaxID=3064386 RepID=UPI00273E5610
MGVGDRVGGAQLGAAGARASGYLAKGNIKSALMNNALGSIADIGSSYYFGKGLGSAGGG